MNRLVSGTARDRHDGNILHLLQVCDIDVETLDSPQKISLGDRSGVFTFFVKDWDTGEFSVLHLLDGLTKCFVLKYISNVTLRC